MKLFFLLFFGLPLFTRGQDCNLTRETDAYTKETKLSTGFITVQGATVTIDADRQEIDIFFSLNGGEACFDNNSTAAIYFEGTKLKLGTRNGGTMNCEGFFHFIFKNQTMTTTLLQKLSTEKVSSIVFTNTSKKDIRVTFLPDQQPVFINLATCLVNGAKDLIK